MKTLKKLTTLEFAEVTLPIIVHVDVPESRANIVGTILDGFDNNVSDQQKFRNDKSCSHNVVMLALIGSN